MGSITNTASIKGKLLQQIKQLPESDVYEVLDFVKFLKVKHSNLKASNRKTKLDPKKDPILKLLGTANVEPFAHRIEEELYG